MINPDIFREYDIRGLAETDLTFPVVHKIGLAFGRLMQTHGMDTALLAGDVRLSTPSIKQALTKGLTDRGIHVVDMGAATTPLFYFGLLRLKVDAGIMVTGSHNPKDYNGLKMALGRTTLFGSEIQNLRRLVEEQNGEEPPAAESPKKGSVTGADIAPEYLQMLTGKLKLGTRRLKVAADAGNGAAALLMADFLTSLGVELVPLFDEVDGNFPNHHPDPVQRENLADLIKAVQKHQADLGLAFDGDADRLGVVDERGQVIWGDQLMILFWREILAKHPGAAALVEVKCSQALVDEVTRLGGRPEFCRTGHSLIKARLKEENLLFAGEMSGHMFFADEYYGFDDALYAAGRLLRILSRSGRTLSELLQDIPVYFSTDETRIDCPDGQKFAVIDKISEEVRKDYPAVTVDGVRIIYPEGWGLVRASNTQPALVVRCEAATEKGLEFIKADIKRRILKEKIKDFDW